MKDIRPDLRERLQYIDAEMDKLAAQLDQLENARESTELLLELEEARWQTANEHQKDIFSDEDQYKNSTPLAAIIRTVLADGKEHHLDEIVNAAKLRNYPFGKKSAGRVVHFALTGMKSNNVVEQLGSGYWRMKEKPKEIRIFN